MLMWRISTTVISSNSSQQEAKRAVRKESFLP